MADEISEQIEADALKPAEASTDMGSVKKRPLSELIEADQYVKGKAAASSVGSPWGALRPARFVPPGSQ